MAKTRKQKETVVAQYRQLISESKSLFVVKPKGVSANQSVQLKKDLFDLQGSYHVVKNSLFKIALEQENLPEIAVLDAEEHAVVFTGEAISEAAKVISEFAGDTDKMSVQAGILNKKVISGAQVEELANLPDKDVLIGQLLSVFQGPVRGLVTVLNGNTRELVQVLNAIAETK